MVPLSVGYAIYSLFKKNLISEEKIKKIYKDLNIDPSKPNPWEV